MSMDNCKTYYELVRNIAYGNNIGLTIDASKASSFIDVTSAWVNKGDDRSKQILDQGNTAECNKNYIEYAKVPRTTNCHDGTFKFERGFDEKEKERKEKMNESEKENLRKFAIKIEPKRILQNGPVTVVFWGDGTKTIVRRSENSADDPYSAFCAALAKKIYGNNSRVKKILEKKTVKAKVKEKKGEKKDGGNAENPES